MSELSKVLNAIAQALKVVDTRIRDMNARLDGLENAFAGMKAQPKVLYVRPEDAVWIGPLDLLDMPIAAAAEENTRRRSNRSS